MYSSTGILKEWTSKEGFVKLLWNSSSGLNSSTGILKELCMGNGPQKEGLWNSPGISLVVYSSTGIPKELCMVNGPQKEGLWNSPGIPLVVHSLRGGLEEDLPFRRSRGLLLNCRVAE